MRDDPVALRSERMFGVFARYLAWRMSREFCGVRLSGGRPDLPRDRPLVVYSNHPSWWDPALMIVLAHRLFAGRPGFAPMEQAAFERYGIFRRMGVFGIATEGAAGARRFLEVSERVLDAPGGMMWVNAEGAFTDARTRPVRLRPGVAHLARRRPDALLVPLAMEFGFWDESKPEALARFGEPAALDGVRSVREIDARLAAALERTMDGLAADSLTRNADRFTALVRGRSGTDLVYDGWRRAKSLLRGRRFDPAHKAG